MKKIWASLFVLGLASIIVGTASLCSASSPPNLQSPEDNKLVTIDSLVFSWTAAVPPPGDTVNFYWVQAKYSYGIWGDIGTDSGVLWDTTYTLSKHDLDQFVYVEHLDVIQWQVGVFYVGAMFPEYSEIRSFNVLKTPVAWIDNSSWEAYTYDNLDAVDYQTYLDLCDYGSPNTGYWEPFNSSYITNTIPITLSSSPSLSWTDWSVDEQQTPVHFADRYRIQLCLSSTFDSLIVDVTTNEITYTTSELSPGAYYWRVRSETNDSLVTDWNSPRKFIVASSDASTAPQNLEATPGNGQVSLSWSAPASNGGSAITNYKIYRGTTSGEETLLTTVDNTLTYTDASVTNGLKYYYQVSAVNADGEGPKSNEVNATPTGGATTVPGPVNNLETSEGDGRITLHWEAPTTGGDPDFMLVYRSTTDSRPSQATRLDKEHLRPPGR